MFDFFAKGGVIVCPIILCSVLALAIFVERLISFARVRIRGYGLVKEVAQYIRNKESAKALTLAKRNESPMGRILVDAIEVADQGSETLESVIVNSTDGEVRKLSRYLQALATIANIAPLLGLLGTVVGMIKAFMVIQEMGGQGKCLGPRRGHLGGHADHGPGPVSSASHHDSSQLSDLPGR
jgi:biopolymer transport protein ExbB